MSIQPDKKNYAMKKYSVRKTVQKIKEDKLVLDFLEDLLDKARTEYLQTITESC